MIDLLNQSMNFMQSFGKIIKEARLEKRYSQKQLAKAVEINFTYISKLENDRADYPPSFEVIQKLAKTLNLEEAELNQLSGKVTAKNIETLRILLTRHKKMPALMEFFSKNSKFVEETIDRAGI